MADADRQAVKALLVDALALGLARDLKRDPLPEDAAMQVYRQNMANGAETILTNYERELAVASLSEAVIERLRGDLARRSRVSGVIEVAINLGALLLGLLGGAIAALLDPAKNATEVKAISLAIVIIVVIQFIGNLYLRHFDHRR